MKIGWIRFGRDPKLMRSMTAVLVIGPLVAVIAFIVGFVRSGQPGRS